MFHYTRAINVYGRQPLGKVVKLLKITSLISDIDKIRLHFSCVLSIHEELTDVIVK
ncbi:MAG: hypothetical protein HNEKOMLI_00745 [Sodalis sp. Psp]|nr:hypothetical protein [Sodalis sp. Psp]MCR3757277.1 hypothetical protein [Sodalis sp. Ppy]